MTRGQRVEDVDRELRRDGKPQNGIGDIGVDLLRVAREPVELGARRLERLVESAEPHLNDELAFAALAQPQPLRAGDQPAERRIAGGLPFEPDRATPASASECSATNARPRNEPSEWPRKTIGTPGCSAAISRFKVQRSPTTLSHPPSSAKWPRSAGGGLRPVAAMVAGVNRVAGGVERRGETGVAGAVLGEAMGDLHHRARRPFGQPAPRRAGSGRRRRESSNSLPGIPAPFTFAVAPVSRERRGSHPYSPAASSGSGQPGKFSSQNRIAIG